MIFYLALKAHAILFDFHMEVTLEKWREGELDLDNYLFHAKIDEWANWNPELENWKINTRKMVIYDYNTMLREVRILNEETLQKPLVNDDFWEYFIKHNEIWFLEACFLNQQQRQLAIKNSE